MRIREVEWLPGVREKVRAKHGISDDEVEEAIFERHAWTKRAGPDRYILLGRSATGAYITVFFALESGLARVITARRMDMKERRIYKRAGR